MKKILIALGLIMLTLQGGCQSKEDNTFKVPIYVVKIVFSDSTEITTAPAGIQNVTWETLTGKPSTFPPVVHSHSYSEITDKPGEIDLQQAISEMNVILIPKLTTAQINALTPSPGSLVYDTSINVLKIGNGQVWKTLITGN